MHTPLAPYAARLNIDYPEQLDRLTTFFRLIWVIPIALVLGLLTASGTQGAGGPWSAIYWPYE